ncbi:sulfatase-like hydrolase/transferase [Haloarcula sp. S1CR25-12]|uniref:Sulfatase-like hydrolase/transferase n=1 Tax=Haloarcula saliterrae TaxID=2950534 RepID=A0ABU2F9C5_9EURY|nr:sulfatase [Haloarcula sp. S1CR25-12]MDS0258885.1 sulfatase-like hydrolase/transferase [Haloarcula sp. S1CR25-12]
MTGETDRDDPNIVLFVMDTMRGVETVPADPELTPNLAALAESGTEYTDAFTTAPWTLPAHVSLFTGTYPSKHGAHAEHTKFDGELPTIVDAFADAGYETAGISNNVWIAEEFGLTGGFDTFREDGERTDAWSGAGSLGDRLTNAVRESGLGGTAFERLRRLLTGPTDDGAAATVEWVEDWLRGRDSDVPFFLFANCIEPHLEYRPPPAYAREFLPEGWSYDRAMTLRQDPREFDVGEFDYTDEEWSVVQALYAAEIRYLDEQLGRLRDALERAGEWDDTVFVAVSDHGENIGEHGFLGHQYSLYDTVLHVPLVINGGAFSATDTRSERLVQTADLAPTLLDVAGIDAPAVREASQALSFHPVRGDQPRSRVIAEYMQPRPPIEVLESKFDHVPQEIYDYQRSLRAVRTTDYKFVRGSDGSQWLYDLRADPGEKHDISTSSPRTTAGLAADLDRWLGSFDQTDATGSVTVSDATEDRLADLGYL